MEQVIDKDVKLQVTYGTTTVLQLDGDPFIRIVVAPRKENEDPTTHYFLASDEFEDLIIAINQFKTLKQTELKQI